METTYITVDLELYGDQPFYTLLSFLNQKYQGTEIYPPDQYPLNGWQIFHLLITAQRTAVWKATVNGLKVCQKTSEKNGIIFDI